MTDKPDWKRLDKDLARVTQVERVAGNVVRPLLGVGIALLFMALAGLAAAFVLGTSPTTVMVAVAAIFGAYLALNIGANDVANNMGPAVGAKALPMGAALIAAALAETAGALFGGSEVVTTVSQRLIDPSAISAPEVIVQAMMAAMVASALWVNFATWFGAPVSTTQTIIGAIIGATTAAAGFAAVDWLTFGGIAASWSLSPIIGAALAMALLALVRRLISEQTDKVAAARRWMPVLLGGMGGAFGMFFTLKLPDRFAETTSQHALVIGLLTGLLSYAIARPLIRYRARQLEHSKGAIKALFRVPLVIAALLMSFAHGANDVANAIGPLAAILQATTQSQGTHPTEINAFAAMHVPLWALLIGAVGMAMGVLLFGPRLINMVGSRITKLNPIRAYCISTSAALTVIVASWLGIPVSSTHVAVGAVMGVGFYREFLAARALRSLPEDDHPELLPREDRSRRRLVRRSHVLTIVAAWLITVPLAATLAAALYSLIYLFLG